MSQLALGTIGRSRSLINQSQESLDPGDHYDHSDREEETHQQDADDEDDSGLVSLKLPNEWYSLLIPFNLYDSTFIPRPSNMLLMLRLCIQGGGKRLRVPGKSSRKRLNPQASVDSIEQWKTFNMSSSDLQVLITFIDHGKLFYFYLDVFRHVKQQLLLSFPTESQRIPCKGRKSPPATSQDTSRDGGTSRNPDSLCDSHRK